MQTHKQELKRLFANERNQGGFFRNIEENFENDFEEINIIERKISKASEAECNGDIDYDTYESLLETWGYYLRAYLGDLYNHIYINRDPRGYAIKFTEEFSDKITQEYKLHRDMGGYVILAPDAYEKELV